MVCWCGGLRIGVQLTRPSHSMLCAEAMSRRKILKPRGRDWPLKAVTGGKSSPTGSGPKSPGAIVCETKSGAAACETKSVAAR